MENSKKKLYILALSMGSGGAEKVISLILPYLVKQYSVALVLFFKNTHFTTPKEVELIYFNESKKISLFFKIFSFPISIYKYYKLLKNAQPDVSLSFLTRPNFVNSFCKLFFPNIKVVISERCFPSIAYASSKIRLNIYKILIPLLYNKADILFSNSKHINEDLVKNFKLKIKNKVIYNPIDLPNITPLLIKKENTPFVISCVGSLTKIKNQELLLRAVRDLKTNYTVNLIGDGVLKRELQHKAESLKITDNVKFIGKVKNVNEYLKKSSCFVLTSNSEGFPNVILEALSMGTPVISTNCQSGPLELLNDNEEVIIKKGHFMVVKYGILINVDDEIGLTNAISFLSENIELQNKLQIKGIERSKEYSTKKIVDELIQLIS